MYQKLGQLGEVDVLINSTIIIWDRDEEKCDKVQYKVLSSYENDIKKPLTSSYMDGRSLLDAVRNKLIPLLLFVEWGRLLYQQNLGQKLRREVQGRDVKNFVKKFGTMGNILSAGFRCQRSESHTAYTSCVTSMPSHQIGHIEKKRVGRENPYDRNQQDSRLALCTLG